MPNDNPFRRAAYSNLDANSLGDDALFNEANQDNVVFSGPDLNVYINNKRVINLESITWSISREIVGNYTMGSADVRAYTKGKRVIVGSLVFTQYGKHAFLDQVFDLDRRKLKTIGDLWNSSSPAARLRQSNVSYVTDNGSTREANGGTSRFTFDSTAGESTLDSGASSVSRGLSSEEFQRQLQEQLKTTAALVGAQKFTYPDQVPAFDLTVVGIVQSGVAAARCTIFGIEISQETAGFSQNDLGNSVGLSFVAKGVSPWRALTPELAPSFFSGR